VAICSTHQYRELPHRSENEIEWVRIPETAAVAP
jgi:hypothetical protein